MVRQVALAPRIIAVRWTGLVACAVLPKGARVAIQDIGHFIGDLPRGGRQSDPFPPLSTCKCRRHGTELSACRCPCCCWCRRRALPRVHGEGCRDKDLVVDGNRGLFRGGARRPTRRYYSSLASYSSGREENASESLPAYTMVTSNQHGPCPQANLTGGGESAKGRGVRHAIDNGGGR